MFNKIALLLLYLYPVSMADVAPVVSKVFTPSAKAVSPGIRIAWDHRTLSRISPEEYGYSSYPRMVQLHDSTLLCVYEADGSIMASRSADLGKSWQDPVPVAWRQDGINMAAPDVLELQDQSILVCYNPRPYKISGSRTFGIRTRKSYDGGKTWIHGRLIHEAGHKFSNGCWEPSAIQLPDGEIQLFFADEGAYRESGEQNISLLRSRDGGLTWSEKPEIVSFRKGGRDGMPAPLLLQNEKEIVCAIEDTGWLGYFKPSIVRTKHADNWLQPVGAVDPGRTRALANRIAFDLYAGAPDLVQAGTGPTLLSYQGTENRRNRLYFADMKVVIGNDRARNFDRKSAPFIIPRDKHALWNSLTILDDSTVAALTSTNAFAGRSQIWLIKGHVIPELLSARKQLVIDGLTLDKAWDEPLPIFIGHTGPNTFQGGIGHDDEFLYMYCRVDDATVYTESATPGSNDGVCFMVHRISTNSAYAAVKPTTETLSFFLTADNVPVLKIGENGRWEKVNTDAANTSGIHHASRLSDNGYVQEFALPWSMLGEKPSDGASIVFNISITENSGRNVPDYRESISACDEDKPYTWLPLTLDNR